MKLGDALSKRHDKARVIHKLEQELLASRQLYFWNCTELPQSFVSSNSLRNTNVINLYRIKIETFFTANDAATAFGAIPWVVNLALVSRKDQRDQDPTTVNFFFDHATNEETSFDNPAMNGYECNNNPLNTDIYDVLYRTKRVISPERTVNDQNPKFYFSWKKSFKINRQLDYTGETGTSCRDKIHFLVWFDCMTNPTDAAQVTDQISMDAFVSMFWKDIRL